MAINLAAVESALHLRHFYLPSTHTAIMANPVHHNGAEYTAQATTLNDLLLFGKLLSGHMSKAKASKGTEFSRFNASKRAGRVA
jgi:hypothetical protein